MLPHPTVREWRLRFGDTLPAGFLCRQALADRWLRIHSLPLAKRYADSESERCELLRRQNAAASYTLGEGSNCVLFITRFGEKAEWSSFEEVPLGGRIPEHVLSSGENDEELQFFALPVAWRQGAFDELILAVADDRTGPVLFADNQRGCLYAPYDGGADLFFPSSEAARSACTRFGSWLSSRDDGL
jgi:hypothetical protein